MVADVLGSAFDSAGQRCSALRVLCLQDDIAERTVAMLKAAMIELTVGRPDRLSTDLGPVISPDALASLTGHVSAMRARGFAVYAPTLSDEEGLPGRAGAVREIHALTVKYLDQRCRP